MRDHFLAHVEFTLYEWSCPSPLWCVYARYVIAILTFTVEGPIQGSRYVSLMMRVATCVGLFQCQMVVIHASILGSYGRNVSTCNGAADQLARWFYQFKKLRRNDTAVSLTLTMLTWRIWWSPTKASKWQMGLNLLAPNDIYIRRVAHLTSRRCILNILNKYTYWIF